MLEVTFSFQYSFGRGIAEPNASKFRTDAIGVSGQSNVCVLCDVSCCAAGAASVLSQFYMVLCESTPFIWLSKFHCETW